MARDPFRGLDGPDTPQPNDGAGASGSGGEGASGAGAPADRMVPREKYDQAVRERTEARARHDELVRAMISGGSGQAERANTPAQGLAPAEDELAGLFPEGSDEDAVAFLKPAMGRLLDIAEERAFKRLSADYGAGLDYAQREATMNSLAQRVPGFNKQLVADVQKRFSELPEEERARYDNDVGFEVLAAKLRLERLEGLAGDTSGRAHSEPFGAGGGASAGGGEASIKDVYDLPQEEFDKLVARAKAGERVTLR